MPLSPKARRAAAEYEQAIHDGNVQHVLALSDRWGLSNGDRIAVAGELDRRHHAPDVADADDVALRFNIFDQAACVPLAHIWSEARA